jgi:hypothetical protein
MDQTSTEQFESLKAQINAVLDANPDLTEDGVGAPDDRFRWSLADTKDFRDSRERLCRVDLGLLARAVDWLNTWPRTKHVNSRFQQSSYGLKHVFEREAGEYIANGEFILAGLIAGLQMQRHPNNLNVHFNLSSSRMPRVKFDA